ncbi:hypothetical protein D3C75_1304070 [compost metagenome]
MMQHMRAVQALEVTVARLRFERPVPVHDTIVDDHVNHPKRRHPRSYPLQWRMPGTAKGHQGEGDQCQGQQVNIVGFQRA